MLLKENFREISENKSVTLSDDLDLFNNVSIDKEVLSLQSIDLSSNNETTLDEVVEVASIGTFNKNKTRTLRFTPTDKKGWWIKRTDIPNAAPIKVSIENAWVENNAGVSNIVIGEKTSLNRLKLTEHIIALKPFIGIDNLVIETDSDDPPLFVDGSLDIVNALKSAKKKTLDSTLKYSFVEKPIVLAYDYRGFMTLEPPVDGQTDLIVDTAISYPKSILGNQRVVFSTDGEGPIIGSIARTNASYYHCMLSKTFGRCFKEIRSLGYNKDNLLVYKKDKYHNIPRLDENGKSLEAVWHRGVLDLLAAVALVPNGKLIGKITSFKLGHVHDVDFFEELTKQNLLKTR